MGILSRKPNILQLLPALLLRESLLGPSLTAVLLEETRDRGKGFRAKDGSESVR